MCGMGVRCSGWNLFGCLRGFEMERENFESEKFWILLR